MSEETNQLLSRLRNPWGVNIEELRSSRVEAADLIERLKTNADALEAALRNLEVEASTLWRAATIAKITSGIDETPIVNTIRDARVVLAAIDKERET